MWGVIKMWNGVLKWKWRSGYECSHAEQQWNEPYIKDVIGQKDTVS